MKIYIYIKIYPDSLRSLGKLKNLLLFDGKKNNYDNDYLWAYGRRDES